MKRIISLIIGLAVVLSGMTVLASPASAKVDKRPCVSRAEFRQVHRPMTTTQVRNIFDRPGYEFQRFDTYIDDGYWDSTWIDDGYWDSYDWNGDGVITPDEEEWIDTGYWLDQWVDTGYWMTDTFRSYPKCHDKNFDRGRGRVALNFDNYSSAYSGLRVYSKFRNNPWSQWARSVVDAKPKPAEHTPQNTPAPHKNLKRTVIKK